MDISPHNGTSARPDFTLIANAKREASEWNGVSPEALPRQGEIRVLSGRADSSLWTLYERILGPGSTPAEPQARIDARQRLEKGIQRLTATFRRVVVLFDIDGRSVEDVAEEVNRSEGATYMLRARAHRRLRTIMLTEPRGAKRTVERKRTHSPIASETSARL